MNKLTEQQKKQRERERQKYLRLAALSQEDLKHVLEANRKVFPYRFGPMPK